MAEKFENEAWTDIQEAPVDTSLSYYAVVFDAGNFYYFGGLGDTGDLNSILRLNAATWAWSTVGQLNSARRGHGVMMVGNTFMVIGGVEIQPTETCNLNNGQFTCEEKNTRLNRYYYTPSVFLVSDDFELCQN